MGYRRRVSSDRPTFFPSLTTRSLHFYRSSQEEYCNEATLEARLQAVARIMVARPRQGGGAQQPGGGVGRVGGVGGQPTMQMVQPGGQPGTGAMRPKDEEGYKKLFWDWIKDLHHKYLAMDTQKAYSNFAEQLFFVKSH